MREVLISTEYIKLDAFLKWASVVGSGVEAKQLIQDGLVKVNNEVEVRRGKKLYKGDTVEFNGEELKVI